MESEHRKYQSPLLDMEAQDKLSHSVIWSHCEKTSASFLVKASMYMKMVIFSSLDVLFCRSVSETLNNP